MLKIALPKGKSLEDRTFALFSEARISITRSGSASHVVRFDGCCSLSEGLLLKPSRVPVWVADGDADVGITGRDTILESGIDVEVCASLAYSRTTDAPTEGVLFVHQDDPVRSVDDIPAGAVIISEYLNLTRQFFSTRQPVEVVWSPGSAEAEVPLKYRFGMALSETGKSLRDNGLRRLAVLFTSDTVLIASKAALADQEKREEIRMLQTLLLGALRSRSMMMLSMNVPSSALEQVLRILPSLGSPTIAPLAGEASFSVSSVVPKAAVNDLVPSLLRSGARGLITLPITSVIDTVETMER